MKKYSIALILLLFSSLVFADNSASFSSFYVQSQGWWGFVIAAGIAAAIGAIIFFTGGTASPLVDFVGSAIGGFSGLSGAAATSAGLALLGGGSIASGGLGIAGGAALLTAVFTFSTDVVVDYAVSTAVSSYQYNNLVEKSKDMPTLAIPVNDNGSASYEKAIEILKKINKEEIITSNANKDKIKKAISYMENDTTTKSKALKALLYFISNDYEQAKYYAEDAIDYSNGKNTLPEFIYAVSLLYDEDFSYDSSLEYFKGSVINEPDNKLIPLMFSIYLDRYILRFGADDKFLDDIFNLMEHYEIKEFKTQNYTILLSRHFILLKQEQQKITVLANTLNNTIKESPKTLTTVKQSLTTYNELIYNANLVFDNYSAVKNKPFWGIVKQVDFAQIHDKYEELLEEYTNDKERLLKLINTLADYQNNISQLKSNFAQLEQKKIELDKYNNIINDSDSVLEELFNLGFDAYSELRIVEFKEKLAKYRQQYTELTEKLSKKRNILIAYLVAILLFIAMIIYVFRSKILNTVGKFQQQTDWHRKTPL